MPLWPAKRSSTGRLSIIVMTRIQLKGSPLGGWLAADSDSRGAGVTSANMLLRGTAPSRHVGPGTIVGLVVAYVALWLVLWPTGEPAGAYVGQLVGGVSVLLLSAALVLISSLPWFEEWSAGTARAALRPRRVAIPAPVLLAARPALP